VQIVLKTNVVNGASSILRLTPKKSGYINNNNNHIMCTMSELILEVPKAFLQEKYSPRHGANNFSYQLLHQFIAHYTNDTIILLTDANDQEFTAFKTQINQETSLVYATYSTLETVLGEYESIQFAFISDLNILKFLKFRNYFQFKIPVIGLIHALGTRDHVQMLQDVAKHASNIDCLICPSKSTQQTVHKLADRLKLPLLKDITTVINHSVNSTHFIPSENKAELRKELDIKDDQIVLLNVCRINPYTKMDLLPLIDNVKDLVVKYPTLLLLIVGSVQVQDYYDEVKAYVSSNNLDKNVRFIANPRPPFNKYFQVGDIFVSLIDNSIETFGLTVVEAMASELPVVISGFGPYLELIENNKEGHLIPTYMFKGEKSQLSKDFNTNTFTKFGDAFTQSVAVDNNRLRESLISLIESPSKRKLMGTQGRETVLNSFDTPLMIKNYVNCFERHAQKAKTEPLKFNGEDVVNLDELFLHFSDNVLESNVTLCISERGRKVLLEEETLLMFMQHKMQYPYLPQIVNILNLGESNMDNLSNKLGVDMDQLSGDIMYLLKHDLVMIGAK
jgi:glycosyltransferase involved in cell wall biosynthesis